MKKNRIVLLVAMVLYVASFFVSAVRVRSGFFTGAEIPGYGCAEMTIIWPWSDDGTRLLHEFPFGYIALLLSGWINLIFLVTVVLLFRERARALVNIFRILLLLMLPACWIVFFYQDLRPSYGYYLWIAAMLLALFSSSLSNLAGDSEAQRKNHLEPHHAIIG